MKRVVATYTAICDCCGVSSNLRSKSAVTLHSKLGRAGWVADGFRDFCVRCSHPHDRTDCKAGLAIAGRYWRAGEGITDRAIYMQAGLDPADDDALIGVMDTPELAALVVATINEAADKAWTVHEAEVEP